MVLEVGASVSIELPVENRAEPLMLVGVVAWKRNDAVGIKFEPIQPDDEKLIQRMVDSELGLSVEELLFAEDEATADLVNEDSGPPTVNGRLNSDTDPSS